MNPWRTRWTVSCSRSSADEVAIAQVRPNSNRRRPLAGVAFGVIAILLCANAAAASAVLGRGSTVAEVPSVVLLTCAEVWHDTHHLIAAAMPRVSRQQKEATHERIVEAAARAIRRSGYGGTGVADIMKDVGLTHGGFYVHFASRDAMLAEAADRAGAEAVAVSQRIAAAAPPQQALQALLHAYLSKEHIEDAETGCPIAALGSETPRQAPEVRRAATRRIKEMIDVVARQLPDWGQQGAHERALVTVAAAVGTLLLARAVDDPKLCDALREATLKYFAPSGA